MARAMMLACMPWVAALVASVLLIGLLVRFNRTTPRLSRIRLLHRDEGGGVQSLSFVLTLPFFMMIMLFIVQVSQLMIGTIVVHYAAFAAARAATVWIPADLAGLESANCISANYPDADPNAPQSPPVLDPDSPDFGPSTGGMTYAIEPGSPKFDKITSAAIIACMAISPSRDLGIAPPANSSAAKIKQAYMALDPNAASNARISTRIDNKLAWAGANTKCEIRFYHRNNEPPLVTWFLEEDILDYRFNELGWQDQITVTVKHNFALLPGPGRFLSRMVTSPGGGEGPGSRIYEKDGVYTYPLQASATMNIEGEQAVVPYVYQAY